MRILLLTQFCEPETHITKAVLFARALAAEGNEVQILTGFPNYPGGKVFPGYRIKVLQRETIGGVPILRVPLYPSHDSSGIGRALNYGTFAASASLLGTLFAKRPDIIYVWHPPLTVGVAAIILGFTKRAPFVYDILDLWPDTLEATGAIRSRRILDLVSMLAMWVYRKSGHVVVQSTGFKRALVARGVPENHVDVILNWSNEDQLRLVHDPEIAAMVGAGERFNVVFAGTMGKAQGIQTVLEAAQLTRESDPDIQFVLVGGGIEVDALKAAALRMGLDNVLFLPVMPITDVGKVMDAADVLLAHLIDVPLFEITIPGKMQAYLSVGKPVLMAVRGEAAEIISASGGGIACEPGDPMALADAVVKLSKMEPSELREMGKRGQAFYRAELSVETGTRRFLEVFRRTLDKRQGRRSSDGML